MYQFVVAVLYERRGTIDFQGSAVTDRRYSSETDTLAGKSIVFLEE
jgi:hypothetical protein